MLAKKSLGAAPAAEALYVEDVFSTYLYTGNGSTQTITNNIDLSGEGGLVWIKKRNNSTNSNHQLTDTVRGAQKPLLSNSTNGELAASNTYLSSFSSTGFSIGSDANYNNSSDTYASWTFRKAEKFFDVVTYTGNGTAGRQIAHNLGSAPGMVIVKDLNNDYEWECWHRSLPIDNIIRLNVSDAAFDEDTYGINAWNKTTPTSTHVTLGNYVSINGNGNSYVMYVFAHDAGGFGDAGDQSIIKCGSVVGSSQVEVSLGWEPQWILVKNTSAAQDWWVVDNMRGLPVQNTSSAYNASNLRPNLSDAETTGFSIAPSSTGFKANVLTSGDTYIYIAIRRGPMKTPTSGTSVFTPTSAVDTTQNAIINAGFPVDLVIGKTKDNTNPPQWSTRMLGGSYLLSSATDAETAWNFVFFDSNVGYRVNASGTYLNSANTVNWMLRRAPGFFDVVCYNGTGVNRTVSHNLGAVPEFIIVKARDDGTSSWRCYAAPLGATKYIDLNSTGAAATSNTPWNDTTPTSSVFTVGTSSRTNDSALKYVAYLFASVSGVSKVGSYTGTGSPINIDCGFTNGARFVLIKQTDSADNWYVWDTARGIVSGNEKYLQLNKTDVESTAADDIDPYSAGFTVNSLVNSNGASYIYLAIA